MKRKALFKAEITPESGNNFDIKFETSSTDNGKIMLTQGNDIIVLDKSQVEQLKTELNKESK